MSGSKKGSTEGQKRAYKRYEVEGRYAKNKKAKLDRHLKKFPKDEVAKAARANVRLYARAAPKSPEWSATEIQDQMLFASAYTGKQERAKGAPRGGDVRKIREDAVVSINKHLNQSTKEQRDGVPGKKKEVKTTMFRLGERARYV